MNKIDQMCRVPVLSGGEKKIYNISASEMFKFYRKYHLILKKKVGDILDQLKPLIEEKTDARRNGRGFHNEFVLFDKYEIQMKDGIRYFQIGMDLDKPAWPTILWSYDEAHENFENMDRMITHPEYQNIKFEDIDLKAQHLVNAIKEKYHTEE
jgi:hypothetical protein